MDEEELLLKQDVGPAPHVACRVGGFQSLGEHRSRLGELARFEQGAAERGQDLAAGDVVLDEKRGGASKEVGGGGSVAARSRAPTGRSQMQVAAAAAQRCAPLSTGPSSSR